MGVCEGVGDGGEGGTLAPWHAGPRSATASGPAAPADVFAVLTDPAGQVAIDSSGMLMSADGERVRAVGDSFVVHMDRDALGDRPTGH